MDKEEWRAGGQLLTLTTLCTVFNAQVMGTLDVVVFCVYLPIACIDVGYIDQNVLLMRCLTGAKFIMQMYL